MEQLKFSTLGQWTLEKNLKNGQPANADYNTYRNMDHEGSLKEDHGQKGSLHGNPPSRSPKHTSKNKMQSKQTTPTASQYSDNNPGLKPTT